MTQNTKNRDERRKAKAESINRRQVLGGLSLAGATLASAPATAGQPDAPGTSSQPDLPEYRETDHIRRFYELARR